MASTITMNDHLENLVLRIPALDVCARDIDAAFGILLRAFEADRKLLLCGNGGSASDAEHWAGELLKGFVHKRPLPAKMSDGLSPELAGNLQWAFPAIPLTGFPALATAFANDVDPDFTFAQLVWALGRPGDVLVALSTSGNSRNVRLAAEVARFRGLSIISLTGQTDGKLRKLSDACVAVPATETFLVQEYHLPVYHCLCLMLETEWASTMVGPAPAAAALPC